MIKRLEEPDQKELEINRLLVQKKEPMKMTGDLSDSKTEEIY